MRIFRPLHLLLALQLPLASLACAQTQINAVTQIRNIIAALPYTPANKAGDTFTGMLGAAGGLTVTGSSFVNLFGAEEIGSTTTAGAAYHDYHSSGSPNDYDGRIIVTGGTAGTSGQGNMQILAATVGLPTSTTIGGNAVCTSAGGASCPAGGSSLSPSGSTTGQIIASGGSGNAPIVLTAAVQRASDNALLILKRVEDLPTVDVTSTSSAWYTTAGCANPADNTGTNDSSCAVQAAAVYASKVGAIAGLQSAPAVLIPYGVFKMENVHIPYGISVIGAGGTGTTVVAGDPNLPAMVLKGATPTGAGNIGQIGQAAYSVVQGIKFAGHDQNTTGSLLEVDGSYNIFRDLEFGNDGGVALQINPGVERNVAYNISCYNVRQCIMMSDNDNESYFFNTQGLANGKSGSGYGYTDNYVNGAYPAAGTASAPTLLYPNNHAAIQVTDSVNVGFIGGDMKDNTAEAAFKFVESIGLQLNGTYIENETDGNPWPANSSGIILEGSQTKTTITGATTTVTYGGKTLYAWPIASSNWIQDVYGSLADAEATYGTQVYQPYAVMPSDYNRTSTAASTTCSGLYQNSVEIMNTTFAVSGAATKMFYAGARNQNGVYNATTAPKAVPSDYDWGSCTAPPTIEQASAGYTGKTGQGNKVELTGVHSEAVEGVTGVQNGYLWVQGYGASPDYADIVAGITPNAPGTGPEYYTQTGDPNDPAPTTPNYIWVNPPNDIDYGSNPFAGSIIATHILYATINYGALSGDSTWIDPFALAQDGAEGDSEHVAVSEVGAFNQVIATPTTYAGGVATVILDMPSVDFHWDTHLQKYRHDASYYNPNSDASPYVNGIQFLNDFNIYPTTVFGKSTVASGGTGYVVGDILTVGTTGGTVAVTAASSGVITAVSQATAASALGSAQATTGGTGSGATINTTVLATAKPDFRVHLTDGGFSVDTFNAGTQAFGSIFQVTPSGPSFPTTPFINNNPNFYTSNASIPASQHIVMAGPQSSTLTLTYPACTSAIAGAEFEISNIFNNGYPVVVATANSGGIYGATATGLAPALNPQGDLHFICPANGNYQVLSATGTFGTASVAGGAGAGGTVTATATALSNNKFGTVTVTTTAAGTASSLFATITTSQGLPRVPSACTLTPANAATAALITDFYTGTPTNTTCPIEAGATAVPAGTYSFSYAIN